MCITFWHGHWYVPIYSNTSCSDTCWLPLIALVAQANERKFGYLHQPRISFYWYKFDTGLKLQITMRTATCLETCHYVHTRNVKKASLHDTSSTEHSIVLITSFVMCSNVVVAFAYCVSNVHNSLVYGWTETCTHNIITCASFHVSADSRLIIT